MYLQWPEFITEDTICAHSVHWQKIKAGTTACCSRSAEQKSSAPLLPCTNARVRENAHALAHANSVCMCHGLVIAKTFICIRPPASSPLPAEHNRPQHHRCQCEHAGDGTPARERESSLHFRAGRRVCDLDLCERVRLHSSRHGDFQDAAGGSAITTTCLEVDISMEPQAIA